MATSVIAYDNQEVLYLPKCFRGIPLFVNEGDDFNPRPDNAEKQFQRLGDFLTGEAVQTFDNQNGTLWHLAVLQLLEKSCQIGSFPAMLAAVCRKAAADQLLIKIQVVLVAELQGSIDLAAFAVAKFLLGRAPSHVGDGDPHSFHIIGYHTGSPGGITIYCC